MSPERQSLNDGLGGDEPGLSDVLHRMEDALVRRAEAVHVQVVDAVEGRLVVSELAPILGLRIRFLNELQTDLVQVLREAPVALAELVRRRDVRLWYHEKVVMSCWSDVLDGDADLVLVKYCGPIGRFP